MNTSPVFEPAEHVFDSSWLGGPYLAAAPARLRVSTQLAMTVYRRAASPNGR